MDPLALLVRISRTDFGGRQRVAIVPNRFRFQPAFSEWSPKPIVHWLLDPGAPAHFSLPKSSVVSRGQGAEKPVPGLLRQERARQVESVGNKDILDSGDLSCYLHHALGTDSCLGCLGVFILSAH